MKTIKFLASFVLLATVFLACQRELSFESGGSGTPSDGSLQGAPGNCLGDSVGGIYKKDTNLNTANFIDVKVNVLTPGSFTISSDTVNGFYFRATGTFASAGINTVRLQGTGKPLVVGTNSFNITYDSTTCVVPITTVLGTSGGGSAVFSLTGTPGACTGATVQGTYTANVATTASNTATINVTVTTPGTYNIVTSTVNGIYFTASGTFAAAGAQTVILQATGTPTPAGPITIPITAGTSSCSFPLTILPGAGPAVFTFVGSPSACTNATVEGTYIITTPLTAANKVTVQVNVTTIGSYSAITTNTVDGFLFSSGAGTFTVTGLQTVVLTASAGPPISAGPQPFTIQGGGCTFTVPVADIDYYPRTTNSNWTYDFNGVLTDTLIRKVMSATLPALGNSYNIFMETTDASLGYTDSSGYYRRSGGNYYEYIDIGDYFTLDQSIWGEYIFLKDNVTAGTIWTTGTVSGTYLGTPIQVRFKETLQQLNVTSVPINGISYPNTIIMKEEYQYSFDNGANWTTFPDYTILQFSRNIGLIRLEGFDASGPTGQYAELTRYQVF
jgi:hypothetical protein